MGSQPPAPLRPFPCGGSNEPACPPQPGILPGKVLLDWDLPVYTRNEMAAHGQACYQKGLADAAAEGD
jgi:hypothetical protein